MKRYAWWLPSAATISAAALVVWHFATAGQPWVLGLALGVFLGQFLGRCFYCAARPPAEPAAGPELP